MENNNIDQPSMPNVVVEPAKPKKKYNVLAIVLGFVALVLAGLATFFGIKYFEPKGDNTQYSEYKGSNGGELIPEKELSESQREEITTATMADDYEEVESVVNNLLSGINDVYNIQNGGHIPYKPEDLNVYIPIRLSIGGKIRVRDNQRTIYVALESNLEKSGFESTGTLPFFGSAGPKDEGYLNASRNIVCEVYEDSEWMYSTAWDYVYLGCAKTDWTWLTKAEEALIVELETAYHEKIGEYPEVIDGFSNVKPENSKQEPYQTLRVSLGGARGLFYRTSSDAKWQFFIATQAPLQCNDYNTDDLKKAYFGDVCYNGSVESTVQL